jgi:hypothetical protein
MANNRRDQHILDEDELKNPHKPACLNAHVSAYKDGDTCSYRWQGYQKALSNKGKYTWPPKHPSQPPKRKGWDIGQGTNYQTKCNVPFWHESHHVVPHAELTKSISSVGKGDPKIEGKVTLVIRDGLRGEGYNLNDLENVIILPMLPKHGKALGLPIHRLTPLTFHHAAYSKVIRGKLDVIFAKFKEAVENHKVPKYKACKKEIVDISTSTYPQIVSAGELMQAGQMAGEGLEHIPAEHFTGGPDSNAL